MDMNAEAAFTIGQAAKMTGLTEETIRYYEKIELLPQPGRKENGHRVYRRKDVDTLQLIVCLKKTGLSLDAMKPFMKASAGTDHDSHAELVEELKKQRGSIVSQIAALQQIVEFIDLRIEEKMPQQDDAEVERAKPLSLTEKSYFPV
ncbi:MerR family transcriptional regulator [Saccharibacillus sp. CPCC 101409]|uniref:MerR family transcriptional regulator n=1 Tax=Saccharibacillus sp. CPCC 101409 TaxID=3058041 RepID=UPI002670E774|nr:MerR family transcriptional regulator [Saccharibacillus sp. CPCC 101409]MDO3410548.1 MerR family transcriptional regulator [Saccharibacillus sp. CPCC 101409]